MEEVPGEPPSKPLSGAGAGDGLWGARGFLGVVASDQVRCPVGVGLLLTCCSWALSGVSLRLPGLFVGRRDEKGASPGGWPGSGAGTRRTRPSPGGRRARLYADRAKASRSFPGAPSLTTRRMRTHPIQGDQDAERTRPHDGSPGGRDQ